MKKVFKNLLALSILSVIVLPSLVFASPAYDNLQKVGSVGESAPWKNIDEGQNDMAGIVGAGIQAFLGILGVIFIVLIVYAGFTWMTAQGDEEKVTKAKNTIQRALIGLVITVSAYAISYWVINKLVTSGGILK